MAEGINEYFTATRARNAAVVNSTAGVETTQAPSVASMKSYVSTQTASFGDLKSDGTVAMTAPLNTSTFGASFKDGDTNYVTIKANSTMIADYTLTLPPNGGTNGYVLSTNGTGGLSWIAPSTGSVTSVSASAPLSSSGGATPTISISQANTTTNGFLSSTDWNTFNNKVPATRTVNGKALSANVTLTTTDVTEGTNQYFTTGRAQTAAVVNSTAGSETTQAPSVAAIKSFVTTADNLKVDKTTTVNGKALSANVTLTTTDVAEGTNQYFTTGRAQTAAVVNSTAGSETTQAPSVSSVKSYVTSQISGLTIPTQLNDLSDAKNDTSSLFLGTNAGASDDATSNRNIGIGYGALYSNTSGDYNIAIGYQSMFSNTTGRFNTAVGESAMQKITTGQRNTAFGRLSLWNNTTGLHNSALGESALGSITTGSYNVGVGTQAGYYVSAATANETSGTSTYIGSFTKASVDGSANEVVIGYNAEGAGSNSVVLGNDSITKTLLKGSVGIGTASPAHKLDVVHNDYYPASFKRTGSTPMVVYSGTTASGITPDPNWTNKNSVIMVPGDGVKIYGNVTQAMEIDNGGNVGIGTDAPAEKLEVVGNIKGTQLCIGADCRSSWPVGNPFGSSIDSTEITDGTIVAADIDNTSVQQRVSGTCAVGSSIRAIAADGTVTCETDTDTTYSAGTGLSLTGTTFIVNLSASDIPNLDAAKITTGTFPAARLPASTSYLGSTIESSEITDGTITAADLGTNSVAADEIAAGAVGSSEVADNSLTAADLAAGSVGTSEVADNSLTASDLAAGSVGTSEVADNSLTANDLAANSVGASELAANSVGTSETNLFIQVCTTFDSNAPCISYLGMSIAQCPSGMFPISGGGQCGTAGTYLNLSMPGPDTVADGNGSTWLTMCRNGAGNSVAATYVRVICMRY